MNTFDAVMIAEGVHEVSEEESIKAWQHLIDTKAVWNLQGWFGRVATQLIEEGVCTFPFPEENENEDCACVACECNPCDCGYGNY